MFQKERKKGKFASLQTSPGNLLKYKTNTIHTHRGNIKPKHCVFYFSAEISNTASAATILSAPFSVISK